MHPPTAHPSIVVIRILIVFWLVIPTRVTLAHTPVASPDSGVIFAGAGDIASCYYDSDEATARLLDDIDGAVFTLGDTVYDTGSAIEFQGCYAPTWGRHLNRTHPAPGNHDYYTPGATGYFGYFGDRAGDPAEGYYSFDLGDWHIVALNTNCSEIGGCGGGSPQLEWLKADLEAHPSRCTLAMAHHPHFSSGGHDDDADTMEIWQVLYASGAEIVLSGHDHLYERFAPQDPFGNRDPTSGIRQFVVGTGGANLYPIETIRPNSEARNDDAFGVLELTLNAESYSWRFVPVEDGTFTDEGFGRCH